MIGIVCAHPDDECLGMGGTIAKLVSPIGQELVSVLYMGRGRDEQQMNGAYRAAEVLGFSMAFADYALEDNRFDEKPLLELVQTVERWLADNDTITALYTHHHGDLNVDHRLTAQAVLTATRPGSLLGQGVTALYSFEVSSSTEWAFDYSFRPNVFVDVESWWDKKLRALECYFTEMRPYPHPRSPKALEARARYWGSVAGVEMAEPFELIRSVS